MADLDETQRGALAGKSILVTGGGGFIAATLINLLRDTECRIVRLLRQPAAPWADQGIARIEDRLGDARDPELWQSLMGSIDVVFHLAAQTSTYEADRDPRSDLDSNVLPMLLMLSACRARSVCPIVIGASTVTICGLPERLPVDENCPDAPVTIYDLHKQMAENYLKYHARTGAVRGAALRLANVYGPGPRSSRADRGVLNQMVGRALRGEALTVYGRGEQVRDYVHVEDVARAFIDAAIHVDALNGAHFIIGRGEGHTILDAFHLVAQRVATRTGSLAPVTMLEPPTGLSPIEARNFVADSGRFAAATGWRASWALSQGIDSIIESLS